MLQIIVDMKKRDKRVLIYVVWVISSLLLLAVYVDCFIRSDVHGAHSCVFFLATGAVSAIVLLRRQQIAQPREKDENAHP